MARLKTRHQGDGHAGKRAAGELVSVAAMGESLTNGIRIRLFAALREQAGWAEQHWSIATTPTEPLTPEKLWDLLQLPGRLGSVRVAINQQFADPHTPLKPGDELAFLPPISGG